MQPLRSHHRVERTSQGESAWRLQAMEPSDRMILGALRTPQTVADLLKTGAASPGDVELVLLRMARMGWVSIQEPVVAPADDIQESEEIVDEEIENASELEALLLRHQAQSKQPPEVSPILTGRETSWVEDGAENQEVPVPQDSAEIPEEIAPPPTFDSSEPLPFDRDVAESDGLLEALRHPEEASAMQSHRDEWAPASGGLAALLRALGEPVPEGVEVSPDQEEHLRELAPVEPWGGSFSPMEKEDVEKDKDEKPFPRLRDHATDEPRARPDLGALRGSLNKVQQEEAAANAVRERARKLRDQREEEMRKVNERNALNRENEILVRESSTLLGLSQRLARVKKDRKKDE